MKKSILSLVTLIFLAAQLFAQDTPEVPADLSDEEKIYGLSKVWKEADKNFVFFDQVPDLDWDKTYQEFIPKVLATNSTYDYYKELQRFIALLNDGHTRVVVPWQLRKIREYPAALSTELINDKVLITNLLNDKLETQGLKKGMEIIEINGEAVKDFAKKNVEPFVFYSTPQDKDVQIYSNHLLKGHIDEPLNLTVKNAGEVEQFAIDRKLEQAENDNPIFEFKILDNNIGYLKINRFWGEKIEKEFDEIFLKIKKTNALVIDVSENSGGNSGYADYVLRHFVKKSFQTSNWKTPMYMPAYASWGQELKWEDNKGYKVRPKIFNKYTKQVVVLISEKTYSAGEDFVSAFLNTGRGKVIGRPTAGTTGNPIGFALPGMGGFQICSKRDYLSTGEEFVGYGIQPQKEVMKTMDDELLLKEGLAILGR